MKDDDALVGLRFELNGGLGQMSGDIVGKAVTRYLVRKDGASFFELMDLEDLRSAKFFEASNLKKSASNSARDASRKDHNGKVDPTVRRPSVASVTAPQQPMEVAAATSQKSNSASAPAKPAKRRISEQLRRATASRDPGEG